ncbi:MAG: DegT/DnrJ/EryC1/StrS family aminotransferase [Rhodocyclaceae bacterium]|nr:DegT/DnrJ/EryC1/StrS family aminotransferase [Rhodocyclaceae bacterium]MCL4758874.1 DegT/DnrJ/EryC1/StrS family aminotransferase [Rhodocyclaceae bacterium]
MTDPYIVFGAPDIREEDIAEVVASLRTGWLGTGPKVMAFEQAFARYKNVGEHHVAAVNSCTAALHVSMIAANLDPGAEVITTPLTFCATVNAIIHAGLTPVLADVDARTQCIDPAAIEAAITPRTQAIIPVHFAGHPCEMDRIMAIAQKHGLVVIEDCAHAIETEYRGRKAGTFGSFGCFSFYVTKNVTTGEGGMILARSEPHIARAKVLALHGMSRDAWRRFSDSGFKHYQVVECGFKYNMMDLQAAVGLHQLARVEQCWSRRQSIWRQYQNAFSDLEIGRPCDPDPDVRHGHHLYTVRIDSARCGIDRDAFIDRLHGLGIGTGVHYLSLAEHPYYRQRYGWQPQQWPVARSIGRETASLPLSSKLSDDETHFVIEGVRRVVDGDRRG